MDPNTSFTVQTADGVALFVDRFDSPQAPHRLGSNGHQDHAPEKILLIVHGYSEHGGRYRHVPGFLGEDFSRFYAMDLRGHGRSGGIRGHAPSFDAFVDDLQRVTKAIEERERGNRLFLLAHSLGGLIALTLLLREKKVPFEFAVISAPLLELVMPVNPLLKGVARLLNSTLSTLQLSGDLNPQRLSHDTAVVENYIKDRLVHAKVTPRMFFAMEEGMAWARKQTGPLACPLLMLAAGDDMIVSTPSIREFYENLKYRDKELREYPGMFHEVMNEIGKAKVFADIREWMRPRLEAAPRTPAPEAGT